LKKWSLDLGGFRDSFDRVFDDFEVFLVLVFGSRGRCVEGGVGTLSAEARGVSSLSSDAMLSPSSLDVDERGFGRWFWCAL
jgi:hypothetical protein